MASSDVFSRCRRRSVSSLLHLCLQSILRSQPTNLAATLIPAHTKDKLMRSSLKLPNRESSRWLSLLLTWSTQQLRLNLRRYNRPALLKLLRLITRKLRPSLPSLSKPSYSMLTRLVLRECSLSTTDLYGLRPHFDQLIELLTHVAPRLKELVLPLVSNESIKYVANLQQLVHFSAQQALSFDASGLRSLKAANHHRGGLQHLYIGRSRRGRRSINVEDVSTFLNGMPSLRRLSICDERAMKTSKRRSFTYEALHLLANKRGQSNKTERDEVNNDQSCNGLFSCNLRDITILDSSCSPSLLLTTCSRLSSLTIDFKEPNDHLEEGNWFQIMIRNDEWLQLCSRLQDFKLVLPATYKRHHYSLHDTDFMHLFKSLKSLNRLVLVGAGWLTPLPLHELLSLCTVLRELCLIHCNVSLIDSDMNSHLRLRRFIAVGDFGNTESISITRSIVKLMPKLQYLELLPTPQSESDGLVLSNLSDLSEMLELSHLTISLSLQCCLMNMPSLLLILRDFKVLSRLTITWGHKDESSKRMQYMVDWMSMVLKGANVELDVELKKTNKEPFY